MPSTHGCSTFVFELMPKSILITGCSSGIGLDAATTLHNDGWRVFATCRQAKDCDALNEQGLESFVLDYADSESVSKGAAQTLERTGGTLDALFNNGAYGIPGFTEDIPRAAMRQQFETNLFGPFELINHVMPAMRKQGHGHIINCSSVLGLVALPHRGPYNASKFAMEGLTDTLRLEVHGSGIHVVLIEPGPINTKIRVNSRQHFEKWVDVENSAHTDAYENYIKPRLYAPPSGKPDRFELQPNAVTEKLKLALDSEKPKPRYYVTTPTYLAGTLKRLLSTRLLDRISLSH